jgi:hypothetical protein
MVAGVNQFLHTGRDEGDAKQVAAVFVDDYAGAAHAALGVQAGRGHRGAGVDVDDTDAMSGAFGLIGCESRRPGWGVADKHLRDRGSRR